MPAACPMAPSAVSAQVADIQVQGTLLFLDADGQVVHAVQFRLPTLFHPHAASLEAALLALRRDAAEQLVPFPVAVPAAEVNCQEETTHG